LQNTPGSEEEKEEAFRGGLLEKSVVPEGVPAGGNLLKTAQSVGWCMVGGGVVNVKGEGWGGGNQPITWGGCRKKKPATTMTIQTRQL